MMTDLAVIMSIYYADKLEFVKESVESILNQTFSDFEYYIAFDGPAADDVDSYLSSLADPRVKLYRLEENKGLAVALNYLLALVLQRTDIIFIARMDADDISLPARFEKQRYFLLKNDEISCVGSWYEEINEAGKHLSFRKLPVEHEKLRKRYMTRTPFAHPSVMYHRRLIETVGFYPTDTILMEDNVLWGKALKAGLRFANISEYLFKFRKDKNFYIRRSGIKYGWNYIITRFKINKSLNLPVYAYILSLLIGLFKMMPSFILRYINVGARKF